MKLRRLTSAMPVLQLSLILLQPVPSCGGGGGGGSGSDLGSPDAAGPAVDGGTTSGCLSATRSPISTDPKIVALARAATAFHSSLGPDLRHEASFCLEDPQLTSWSYLPVFVAPRKGLQLSELSPSQLDLAYKLFDAFLSTQGYDRLYLIINTLDENLKAMWLGFGYGAGLYRISLYNDPATDGAWGARIEGHHLALIFVVDGNDVYMTPAFYGAEPNTLGGVKIYGTEETLAHALLGAMSTAHLSKALVATTAPEDVVTAPGSGGPDAARSYDYSKLAGVGLKAADMTTDERDKLRALIAQIVAYQDGPFAAAKMADIDAVFGDTTFAWMGPTDGSDRFYFRIYSPKILIEYDLTTLIGPISTGTTHTHMIIRSPDQGDYGPFAAVTPSLEEHIRSAPDHQRERPAPAALGVGRQRTDRTLARLVEIASRRRKAAKHATRG